MSSIPGQPLTAAITTQQLQGGVLVNFDPHELVVTTSAVQDSSGVSAQSFRYIQGGAQDPAITRTATGQYTFNWTPLDDGSWNVTVDEFDGAGKSIGASTVTTIVSPRPVPIPTP